MSIFNPPHPGIWLIMQNQYDLWHAGKKISPEQVKKLDLAVA